MPPKGKSGDPVVERIPVDLGQAQGLLWAFDSLYVVVNGNRDEYDNGLYWVRDTDHDDQFDSVELLRAIDGGGEHGPHAVLLTPDGQSLYVGLADLVICPFVFVKSWYSLDFGRTVCC